jgi:predicted Co/Zn/Cd cation transporter (cation efflux family)
MASKSKIAFALLISFLTFILLMLTTVLIMHEFQTDNILLFILSLFFICLPAGNFVARKATGINLSEILSLNKPKNKQ